MRLAAGLHQLLGVVEKVDTIFDEAHFIECRDNLHAALGRPPRGFAFQSEIDTLREELAKARAKSGETMADLRFPLHAARESSRVTLEEANKARMEVVASDARAGRVAAALEQANRTIVGLRRQASEHDTEMWLLGLLHQHAEGARSALEQTIRIVKEERDRPFEQVDLLKSERVVLQSEVEQATAELEQTRQRVVGVQEELSAAQVQNERLRKSLDRAGQAAEVVKKERNGLAGEVQTLRSAGLSLLKKLYSDVPEDSVPPGVLTHALHQLPEVVADVVMRALEDGSETALALARSHYSDADFGRVVEGFASGYSDKQLDALSVEMLEPGAKVVADFKTENFLPERFGSFPYV